MAKPRIAVVGAGPAGLVLARVLQINDLPCTVFERDSSAVIRGRGGVLDMHVEGGQFAFRVCGLYDEFVQAARYDEQETVLYDKGGNLRFFQPNQHLADCPEIDRPDIRRILLASVAPGSIRWEHAISAVERTNADGSVTVSFRDSLPEEFDLVIGADGAWSRVRSFVSDAVPEYTGATFYELRYSDAKARDPELLALTKHGNMFALGERKAINSHRTASGGVHVYAGLWTGDSPGTSMTRDDLLKQFDTWSPALKRFLELADLKTSTRVIAEMPIGHRWRHRPGVTLVGDAAHLMSPFSGEGANLAMRDATDLALAIARACQNGTDLEKAVSSFENSMCERAEESAAGAAAGVRQAFAENAVSTVAAEMRELLQGVVD